MAAAVAIIAALTYPAAASKPIASTFDTDDEGWKVIADFPIGGPYGKPLRTFECRHNREGGNPAGCVSMADPSDFIFCFQAPQAYLGDKGAYVGGTLSFDLKCDYSNYEDANLLILLGKEEDKELVLVAQFAIPPKADEWTSRRVALTPGSFRYDSKDGAPVSDADFRAIMGNIRGIWISGEFGTQVAETTALDNVRLARPAEQACCAWLGLFGVWWVIFIIILIILFALVLAALSRQRKKRAASPPQNADQH